VYVKDRVQVENVVGEYQAKRMKACKYRRQKSVYVLRKRVQVENVNRGRELSKEEQR